MTIITPNENINQNKAIISKNSLQNSSTENSLKSLAEKQQLQQEQGFKAELERQPNKDIIQIEKEGQHKDDPLLKYPMRGLAYANEIGEATRPFIGSLAANLFWVPALMYFGADIYDKYKKGENEDYSKESNRKGVQQAVFQALASCILPLIGVHQGQHIASKLQAKSKNSKGVSGDAQVEILDALKNKAKDGSITANTTMKEAEENIIEPMMKVIEKSKDNIKNEIKDISWYKFKKKKKAKLAAITYADTSFVHANHAKDKNLVKEFIKKQINESIELAKETTANPSDSFKTLEKKFANEACPKSKAIAETIGKALSKKAKKPGLVKGLGGIAALVVVAMPIDYLVEHVIIKKAVEPGLKHVEKKANEDPNFLGGMFFKGEKKAESTLQV